VGFPGDGREGERKRGSWEEMLKEEANKTGMMNWECVHE